MRFCALLTLLALGVIAGCSDDPSPTSPAPPPPRPVRNVKSYNAPPMPPFRGQAAKSLVKWDLTGNWIVSRQPGKLREWEAKWQLRKVRTPAQLTWEDEYAKATFILTDRLPQTLIWDHDGTTTYFSINDHSPGLLVMTGNDGERYRAMRMESAPTENGE